MSPHLHISMADFVEGSSWDVWVLSPRRVLIIPGPKCSVAALTRFTSYLFAEGWEGEIGEYQNQRNGISGMGVER